MHMHLSPMNGRVCAPGARCVRSSTYANVMIGWGTPCSPGTSRQRKTNVPLWSCFEFIQNFLCCPIFCFSKLAGEEKDT